MKMLHWTSGKTRQDKIENDNIRECVGVAPIVKKMVENRLRWWTCREKTCGFCIKKSRSDEE